ncbi:AAEL009847-PA [Aedes aegypti]|uniref:AAEL009847-PA n=1 Tax=Aedes aegypti TaxID=7159 RepID=Q16UN4_AEDAE|nr:AAEL009847-PA [Aedes aegypti]
MSPNVNKEFYISEESACERLIQYASENLVTEILIHPQINTFIQCIRNLLSSFTRHRHIIHTGYTFAGNGSWILQDGTFSVVDFMEAFREHEVQRVLRAYPDTITMDVHCAPVGNWQAIQDKSFARLCRIRLNPVDVLSSGSEKLNAFVDYLASMIVPTEISELLESSDVVGNIRFSHPTLYVFPGGQGDAALFGINGFNMLVDGGFSRKSCFWDFVRHLDRLDAVLMTRINNTNIKGISAVVERKHEAHVYPQIGHFFCNIPERKGLLSPDGDKDRDPLLVDLIEEGHQIVTNLKSLNLKAQNCYRDVEPINLYHKVGHGTLDMYIISPAKDSKEVKEFLAKWNAADPKLFAPRDSKEFVFPMQNIISICALLVWTPANPEDNITRILFPGSAPEYKILEGLEKMKNVEFMRQPVCTVKSIAPSLSTQALTKKSLKSSSIDKIIPEPILPSKSTKPSEKDNKILDNKMKMIDNKLTDSKSSTDMMDSSADEAKLEKHITKSSVATVATAKVTVSKSKVIKTSSTESTKKIDSMLIESSKKIDLDEKKDSSDAGSDKDETEKKVAAEEAIPEKKLVQDKKDDDAKDSKKDDSITIKDETKVAKRITEKSSRPSTARSRIDTKPPKMAAKPMKKKEEANKSSPTTPKKSVEPKLTNGISKDEESKKTTAPPKTTKPVTTRPGKASPKSTPAKSAKDANNRKVLEARQRPAAKPAPAKKDSMEKKDSPPKVERKPISRRPRGPTSATAVGGSPVKAKKVLKSEKDAVIRKAKLDKNGTTDSSLVSTPSADEAGIAVQKRIIDTTASAAAGTSDMDAIQQQQLAELKEEQEAVREIEAVFKRDSEKIKRHEILSEHREIQDSTTEPEEEEEYLIIEKEEQYTEDSINEPESSATKEEEIQKHQRDSQESEKCKRDSMEGEKQEKADVGKMEGETATVVEIIEGDKVDEEHPAEETHQEDKETILEKEAIEDVKEEPKDTEKLSAKHKQDIEEEVQDIIASAKEIAKSKMETSMDGLKTEEMSSISPDEKVSSTKKTSDTRDENEPEPVQKEHIEPPHESHHEERVSATAESGATTTAPTLPEDERIPLDEIKEDLVIEEKYVKEETKEVEVAPPLPTVYEPLERPTPAKMHFSAQQAHMRDVVKTPDEVADLPMHEEADFEEYSENKDKEDEKERDTKEKPEAVDSAQKKETEVKEPEKTDKVIVDKSAESDKLCDTVKDIKQEVQEVIEKVAIDTMVEKPPKLDTQQPSAKDQHDEADVLKDLESQIISSEPEIKKQPETKQLEQTPEQPPVVADDEEDKKSVHEEVIVAKKVEPKVPVPETSILDEIWGAPQKAEEKLEELKQIIDDKAKETTSDLVAVKDEMFKELVDRKEEVMDKVKQEIIDTDKKAKETVAELAKAAENVTVQAAEAVAKEIVAKVDAVGEDLHKKTQQVDEKVASEVDKIKTSVEQAAIKAESVLTSIETEKKELEKLATDLKQEVSGQIDATKKQLDDELNKAVEQVQEKAKSGISSFFGGITESIKTGIEKVADKVETKLKDKTEQVETRLQEVTDKIEELKGKEPVEEVCVKKEVTTVPEPSEQTIGFEQSFGYERTFTQELRETHITTLDSPVTDVDKVVDMKSSVNIPQHIDEDKELEELESKQMAGSYVIEEVKYSTFEEANLREIKEEEEEDRVTPPQKDDKKSSSPKLEPFVVPQRARTPEDVAKIVANVAEVLKSDKDLEEIIPGFDPHELERKLSQGAAREEDIGTVQRMLVTASSEDGGEETVICPDGTITFSKTATPEPPISGKTTPEIKVDEDAVEVKPSEVRPEKPQLPEVKQDEKASPASSGKSSPDLKTSPTSIEEKDKHELPEKVVIEAKKTPEKITEDRKESIAEQYAQIDDSRRESAISTFSERDYTKDESSILDERDSSRAHSISSHISDLKEDVADVKSVTEFLKESDKQQEVFTEPEKQKDSLTKKSEELSSPESITSQKTVSEKSVAAEAVLMKSEEKIPQETQSSRPESAASHISSKSPLDNVSTSPVEISGPESAIPTEKSPIVDTKSDTNTCEKIEAKEQSRSESAASEKMEDGAKEIPRPESVVSNVSEKVPSDNIEGQQDSKQSSRPESVASYKGEGAVDDKEPSQPETILSCGDVSATKADIKPEDIKEVSRPESVASVVNEKDDTEKKAATKSESPASHPTSIETEKTSAETKESSRPESVASLVSEKALPEKTDDSKEVSRPESAASHISDKLVSEQKETIPSEKVETKESPRAESVASQETKEHSRPESVLSQKSDKPDNKQEAMKGSSRPESVASDVGEKITSEEKSEEIKDGSRPESVASQIVETTSHRVAKDVDEKQTARSESVASHVSEKSSTEKEPAAMEASRPESVTSLISDKDETKKAESKEASRPESAVSHISEKEEVKSSSSVEKDVAKTDEAKEASRPDSVASHVSEKDAKEASRPASVASHVSEQLDTYKLETKEASRPESRTSHTSEIIDAKLKEEPKLVETKDVAQPDAKMEETSRPESVVSHASEKVSTDKATEAVRPDSTESHIGAKATTMQEETSRPMSVASNVSEKLDTKKEEPKDSSRPESVISEATSDKFDEKQKDTLQSVASQEIVKTSEKVESELIASQVSEKTSVKSEVEESSRPESVASHLSEKASSDKVEIKDSSRPESVASHISEKTSSADAKSPAASRPDSVASHSSDKVAEKEDIKKEELHAATQKEVKEAQRPESASSHVSDKPEVKDTSRPESVASHASEKGPSDKIDIKDETKGLVQPMLPVSQEKTDSKQDEKNELSRPESCASHVSEKEMSETTETKLGSMEVAQLKSIASQASEKTSTEVIETVKVVSKEPSRPESVASHTSEHAETKSDAKESSRSASVASHVSDKSEPKPEVEDASRPESVASHTSDKEHSTEKESKSTYEIKGQLPESKEASTLESATNIVTGKVPTDDGKNAETNITHASVNKEDSKPASILSQIDEKALSSVKDTARPQEKEPSVTDSQCGKEQPLKESDSRPTSAASHVSEKVSTDKTPEKEESRPASAVSHVSESAPSDKLDIIKAEDKDYWRPASSASHVSEKSSTIDAVVIDQKESPAPISTVSPTIEKEQKEPSRSQSAASEKVEETSRPVSVASDKAKTVESKADDKEASRPTSAASHKSEKDSHKAEFEKDSSRPASSASHASEKGSVLQETESTKTEEMDIAVKVESKDDKDPSRSASVASHVSETDKEVDEKTQSRPDSAASHGPSDKSVPKDSKPDDKELSLPESTTSETVAKPLDASSIDKLIGEGDFSRPESPASCSSDKVEPSKEPKSTFVEKDLARPDSSCSYHGEHIPDEKPFSRPESPDSCADDKLNEVETQPAEKQVTGDDAVKQVIDTTKDVKKEDMESPEVKEFSRPDSPASCGDETELTSKTPESSIPEKHLAREDSVQSYHGEPIPEEKQFSRPDSPASGGEDETPAPVVKSKESSRPESAASHISGKDKSPVGSEAKESLTLNEKDTSRPTSAASHASDKSGATEAKMESRRESATQEERPSSALSDHADNAQEEKIFMKESRSKSLSAVMSSTPQRIGFEGSALGVLEESAATSRDDLHILKTPRESITKIEEMAFTEKKQTFTASKTGMSLFGPSQFPTEERKEAEGFPIAGAEHESPDQTDTIIPGVDQLLKETASSMKEIEKMSSSVITMIQTTEKKDESIKQESKSSTLAFPLLDSGKSTPMSGEKDKSQTSSIKSTSPHDKDSLEGSSASLNTFIEKDSLSESTSKQVTIKMSAVEEIADLKSMTTSTKVECTELLGGSKTPPTAPISPNVAKEDCTLGQHIESTVTSISATTGTSSSQGIVKQQKEDVSGISTPKESVPSGKSSPGLMSVHTGSTDSASKSINLGHSSGIETSESSPKPTSPFPKLLDTLKTDEVKTSSGMSTPDMTRTSTPDMVDSQIERIPEDTKEEVKQDVITTTTTTTKRYIIKDGEKIEVGSTVKTEVSGDSKKDDTSSAGESMSTSTTTTTTTTKVVKEAIKTPINLTLATTEDRSLTEDYDEKDVMSPRSDISSGQASRIVAGWHDEDVPGSPMSVTSQAPLSPSTKYTYDYDLQHSSSGVSKKSDIEIDDSQDEIPPQYGSDEVKSAITIASAFKPDPMSTSFYGQLPDVSDTAVTTSVTSTKSVPIPITTGKAFTKTYMEYASSGDSSVDSSHIHKSADRKYLDEADLDFEKAFTKSDKVDLMTQSMHFSSEKEFMAATTTTSSAMTTVADSSKKELDFTASGLPTTISASQAQTTLTTTAQSSTTATTSGSTSQQSQSDKDKDPLASWGKPLGLPSPAPLNDENMKTTPKRERKMILSKTKLNNEKNLRKRSESPIKSAKRPAPVYVDLSYVPHHGNSYYANVEFFKRVRARYYVFSGTEPSREVYNALLEAKQTWEDKELEVTIIPTYDTDVLGYWVSENEDLLAKYHIDLSPSAARCTINLQDHETSCSAYRLEF